MGRKDRRAAEAIARKETLPGHVAFHEAGHGVARLLTSGAMGYTPDEAVHSIGVVAKGSWVNGDGGRMLTPQAICMGPMVSKSLEQAAKLIMHLHQGMSRTELWETFGKAGTLQDRQISMHSRMLNDVMGAVAEARYLRKAAPLALFMSPACEDDRRDFAKNCRVLGVALDEIDAMRDRFLEHALRLVDRPPVWAAITAIASELRGTMEGARVVRLAWPHLLRDPEALAMALPA